MTTILTRRQFGQAVETHAQGDQQQKRQDQHTPAVIHGDTSTSASHSLSVTACPSTNTGSRVSFART